MNTYNSLINNLETLELNRIKENIDQFLDMIADGSKTALDAIYELNYDNQDTDRSSHFENRISRLINIGRILLAKLSHC